MTAPSCPPVEENRPRPSGALTTMASQTHWEDVYTRKKVDEVSWCTVDEAAGRLTYAHDRKLVTKAPMPS